MDNKVLTATEILKRRKEMEKYESKKMFQRFKRCLEEWLRPFIEHWIKK